MIGLAGPYDFLPLRSEKLKTLFGPEPERPLSQPINFVTPQAPPMLLAAGAADTTVDPGNTRRLAARLRRSGATVEEQLYRGAGHRVLIGAFASPLAPLLPVRRATLRFIARRHAAGTQRCVDADAGGHGVGVLSLAMMLAWVVQRRAGNAGWVDVVWTFALGLAGIVYALVPAPGTWRAAAWLVAALAVAVGAAAGRLHPWQRTRHGAEDSRYAQLRADWGEAFQRRMFGFLQIQAAVAALLALSLLLAARNPAALGAGDAAALVVFRSRSWAAAPPTSSCAASAATRPTAGRSATPGCGDCRATRTISSSGSGWLRLSAARDLRPRTRWAGWRWPRRR